MSIFATFAAPISSALRSNHTFLLFILAGAAASEFLVGGITNSYWNGANKGVNLSLSSTL